jgi:hypothetical protein
MKSLLILLLIIASITQTPITVFAHPGGTDSAGCHVCRTNCAQYGLLPGQYHCHGTTSITPRPTTPTTPTTPTRPTSPTTPTTPTRPTSPTTPTAPRPTAPSSSSSSSSGDSYTSLVPFIALGLLAVITIAIISNNSSKKLDNSKFNKGIEEIHSKINEKKDKT